MSKTGKDLSFGFSRNEPRSKHHMKITGVLALIAKLIGFVRLQQVATLLGTSYYADVYLLFYQAIWFVEIVLISGAMMPTLVATMYKSTLSNGLDTVVNALFVALFVTTGFGILLCIVIYSFVDVALPNMTEQARSLLIDLAIIGVFVPACLCISSFLSTVNRLIQNGSWYSATLVLINIATLSGLIITYNMMGNEGAVKGSIFGLYFGAMAAIILQLWALPREILKALFQSVRRVRLDLSAFRERPLFWKGTLALLSVAVVQELSVLIDLYFASTTGEGGIGMIGYASRLTMLVNMLLVATPMILLEPRWSYAIANTSKEDAGYKISQDLQLLISLMIAPFVVLFNFSGLVSNVIYNSQLLEPPFRDKLNDLIQIYSLSIFGFAAVLLLSRLLVMHGLSVWLLRISLLALAAKIILGKALVSLFGLPGLAAGTLIILLIQAVIYLWVLHINGIHPIANTKVVLKLLILGIITFGLGYIMQAIDISALNSKAWKFGALMALSVSILCVTLTFMDHMKIRSFKDI